MIKKLGVVCLFFMEVFQLQAQCSELFISEYIEGSRNNKALEIYNPTDKPIDLSQYRVTRWQNGSASWTARMSDLLSGTIQPKDVIVLVIDRRDTTKIGQDTPVVLSLRLKADLFLSKDYNTSYSMSFNGDDAMSLDKLNATTNKWVPVDILGKIGERPSPAWSDKPPYTGSGTWYTMDKTLIRNDSVMAGIKTNPTEFNPKKEWLLNPRDMFDSLGFHHCLCAKAFTSSAQKTTREMPILFPNPVLTVANAFLPFLPTQIVCINAQGQSIPLQYSIIQSREMVLVSAKVENLEKGVYYIEFFGTDGARASARMLK